MASRNGYTAQQSSDLYKTDGDRSTGCTGSTGSSPSPSSCIRPETIAKPTDHEPPDEVIAGQNQRNREAMLYFLERAGCAYTLIGKSC